MDSLLNETMLARRDAPTLPDSFPLVLVAHGNGHTAIDQAILCEYLASHGYVVVSVPSPMIARPMNGIGESGDYAERQSLALEAAAHTASRNVHVRLDGIAIVSHSFGARAALLHAMRADNVETLVSLDGGIGTRAGIDELRTAPSFDLRSPVPRLLHVYERLDEFMAPDFAFLTSLDVGTLTLTGTPHLHHIHFTTLGFLAAAHSGIATLTRAEPEVATGVAEVARWTLDFLDDTAR